MASADPVASTLGILVGLLFTLVGPIKAMPTFHAMTANMAPRAATCWR